MISMESISAAPRVSLGTVLLTAVAPLAWGTTYIVTENFLPPDRPLFAATVRALPVGLVLLAWRRRCGGTPPATSWPAPARGGTPTERCWSP